MALKTYLRDKRLWAAIGLIGLLVGLRWSGLADQLTLETLRTHRGGLQDLVARHPVVSALAYIAVYVAAVALSLPGAVFLTLSGGFLFGALSGTLFTVVAATLGASLIFLFARILFGADALERFGPAAAAMAAGVRRNAAAYLLVLRLVPIFPFFLVNLVPALIGVPLRTYVATTFVGIIPATAVFSVTGAGLGAVLDSGETLSPASILTPEIIAGLCGLALLSLVAIPLKKWLSRSGETPAP
ncbi:TVP38/TMEM64 family protein [Phreatobacter oligotrophus]|uniref:TVP38/TMEM64 family protein n=1 Tax=Phreatobacter oligotrophus TaxID=1122261 RepID=UPI0023548DD2|nr:VTT domain-containing protein [Phreatobacter oligotrophus]MBX9992125.1 VTT domain-containing protein [Phreatobacter oligotrophus]